MQTLISDGQKKIDDEKRKQRTDLIVISVIGIAIIAAYIYSKQKKK